VPNIITDEVHHHYNSHCLQNIECKYTKHKFLVIAIEPAKGVESVFILREIPIWGTYDNSLVLSSFVAVYLTFAQFNLRLQFCLYTVVHLLG